MQFQCKCVSTSSHPGGLAKVKRKSKGVSSSSTNNYQVTKNGASGSTQPEDYTYPLSGKSSVPSESAYTSITAESELSTSQHYADPRQGQPMTTAGIYHTIDSHPSETQYADPTSPSYRVRSQTECVHANQWAGRLG